METHTLIQQHDPAAASGHSTDKIISNKNKEKESSILSAATQATHRALVKAELYLNRTLPLPEITYNLHGKTAGIFQKVR